MKYSVEFSDKAKREYMQIGKYLSRFYESTPKKFYDAFEKRIPMLEENPYAFAAYEDVPDLRRAVVMDYLVFYKVIENTRTVEIHRILHSTRNIENLLNRKALTQ